MIRFGNVRLSATHTMLLPRSDFGQCLPDPIIAGSCARVARLPSDGSVGGNRVRESDCRNDATT